MKTLVCVSMQCTVLFKVSISIKLSNEACVILKGEPFIEYNSIVKDEILQ